jgi:hypothetical protein
MLFRCFFLRSLTSNGSIRCNIYKSGLYVNTRPITEQYKERKIRTRFCSSYSLLLLAVPLGIYQAKYVSDHSSPPGVKDKNAFIFFHTTYLMSSNQTKSLKKIYPSHWHKVLIFIAFQRLSAYPISGPVNIIHTTWAKRSRKTQSTDRIYNLWISGHEHVTIHISTVFWVVNPCSLLEVYWCFRGTFCLYLQCRRPTASSILNIEITSSSETSVYF